MKWLIKFFEYNMAKPELYGWFHILSLVLTVLLIVILLKFRTNEKNIRWILGITSIIVILLEVYKQLYFCIDINQNITFEYRWNLFPWQFCSTPMYIGLLASIVKNRKLHYRLCCYLCTYALMAGICVMIYPSSVFTENVLINIQTMVNHGTMVAIGVYLLLCDYVKCEKKTLLEAFKVFSVCITIAIILNEWAYYCGIVNEYPFNMFYISPYVKGELPVFGDIQAVVSYPVSLIVYIVGFTLGSGILLWIIKRKDECHEYISCR